MSNDISTFMRSPCNEEYAKQRKAAKDKILTEIREEAKRMEKIKLIQKLQEEREKLQNLLKRKQGCNLFQKNESTCVVKCRLICFQLEICIP